MKTTARVVTALFLLTSSSFALAKTATSSSEASERHGISITDIITAVAQKSAKKFLVDPRVRAEVTLVGQKPSNVTYSELLTILQLHGFAAIPDSHYVRVVPDA